MYDAEDMGSKCEVCGVDCEAARYPRQPICTECRAEVAERHNAWTCTCDDCVTARKTLGQLWAGMPDKGR